LPAHQHPALVAVQADGKILVGGLSMESGEDDLDFMVARLNVDGSLDTAFAGGTGVIKQPVGESDDYATSIEVQEDGAILVAGFHIDEESANIAVARFTADGILDESFGTADDGTGNGIVSISLGDGDDIANSMVLQPDGKIVLGGFTSGDAGFDLLAARLNADGSVDTGFGERGDGFTLVPLTGGFDYGMGVAIGPGGDLVITGFSGDFALETEDIFVTRLTPDGLVDPTFGTGTEDGSPDGFVTVSAEGNDEAFGVAIAPDGGIVIAGNHTDAEGTMNAINIRVLGDSPDPLQAP